MSNKVLRIFLFIILTTQVLSHVASHCSWLFGDMQVELSILDAQESEEEKKESEEEDKIIILQLGKYAFGSLQALPRTTIGDIIYAHQLHASVITPPPEQFQ